MGAEIGDSVRFVQIVILAIDMDPLGVVHWIYFIILLSGWRGIYSSRGFKILAINFCFCSYF